MKNDFLRRLFCPENRQVRMKMAAGLVLGIALLLCSRFVGTEAKEEKNVETVQQSTGQRVERELEAELERVLSQVAGAGQVQVLLTYATTSESTPAREEKIEESNGNNEDTVSRESTVVLMEDGSGGQSPLILTETAPQVEGVLIVAQGADDPVVCDALSRAAQALLQVPAHKIAILKMK